MPYQRFKSLSVFILTALIAYPTLAMGPGNERRAILFYTGEVHGTIEPCGCTSDPLGDLARVTGIVRQAARAKKNVLFVDAGNLSFPTPSTNPLKKTAARLRAEFIGQEFERLPLVGCAIGQADLSPEGKILPPRRIATNVEANDQTDAFRLAEAGGIRFGILGYIDPQVAKTIGLVPLDATQAIREVATRLRVEGADILVLLAPVDRPTIRSLARNLDLDFIVFGKGVGEGLAKAERIGHAYLLAPSEETQRLGRLEIVLPAQNEKSGRWTLSDAGGVEHNQNRMAEIVTQHARLQADLKRWQSDPTADPAFIEAKVRESVDLQKELKQLRETPWTPPREGAYFTNVLIPIQRHLARDPALARGMRKLDEAIASASLKLAEPPPPAEEGQAGFVGDAKCVSCHKAAARSFATTRHAHAWATLVKAKKTGQEDCVSCHVTGFGEIGGTTFGFTKGLKNVQCEACHGPGSIHVEKRGKETPFAGVLKTPESLCVRCHNEKHSDTFQYEAYLRDVLGPGHGEDARDRLGPGPTGKELRRAAMKRVKQR